jgi:hypothetical protein
MTDPRMKAIAIASTDTDADQPQADIIHCQYVG